VTLEILPMRVTSIFNQSDPRVGSRGRYLDPISEFLGSVLTHQRNRRFRLAYSFPKRDVLLILTNQWEFDKTFANE
jgi:hypothetical protein